MPHDTASSPLVAIYALTDPRDGTVRYVGKSKRPQRRLAEHKGRGADNPWRARWIAEVRAAGYEPGLRILEWCSESEWKERERHWEAVFRSQGEPLTNLAECGKGRIYYFSTEAGRAHMRAVLQESRSRPEVLDKARAGIKASWATEERREHARRVHRGSSRSEETRERMREAQRRRQVREREQGIVPKTRARVWAGFVDPSTGAEIPPLENLAAFCRGRGLNLRHMSAVYHGKRRHHRGWTCVHRE